MYLPRERARKHGLHNLSDYELVALVFRTGMIKQDVLTCSKELLKDIKGLAALGDISVQRLCEFPGIGESKAYALLAGIELGKRIYQYEKGSEVMQLRTPNDCVLYFSKEFKFYHHESFVVIFLNTKNMVIGYREVYKGGLNTINVHPREIFRAAIEYAAAAIILVHNHPSGDPKPSKADIETTKVIAEAGTMVGIPVLDHLIIGAERYCSMKESGYFDETRG